MPATRIQVPKVCRRSYLLIWQQNVICRIWVNAKDTNVKTFMDGINVKKELLVNCARSNALLGLA